MNIPDWEHIVRATANPGTFSDPVPEGHVRYVAGFALIENAPAYSIHAVVETEPGESYSRVGNPVVFIPAMSREQAEHLHMQLGNALGFK